MCTSCQSCPRRTHGHVRQLRTRAATEQRRRRRCGSLSESNQIAALSIKNFHFDKAALPREIQAKGVGKEAIPRYAYRDDGLLIYNAIKTYLEDYITTAYPTTVRASTSACLPRLAHRRCSPDP